MTKHKRTTDLLKEIADNASNEAITLHEFNEKLGDRSFGLGLLIFGLLNNLPLLSAIFSIPVVVISIQMILGLKQIKLPKFLENKTFDERALSKIINKILPSIKIIEVFIKPRLDFMTSPFIERIAGVICMILGVIIFLPFPGANLLPSVCVCLIAAAILEKDGVLMIAAIIISLGTIYAVKTILLVIKKYILQIVHYLFG
ncbi:MAG TPA: sugar transporter [Alphaproteobacteria bacterium]|nr:sugar transporter [Alphaproteobacteria bacterium]